MDDGESSMQYSSTATKCTLVSIKPLQIVRYIVLFEILGTAKVSQEEYNKERPATPL